MLVRTKVLVRTSTSKNEDPSVFISSSESGKAVLPGMASWGQVRCFFRILYGCSKNTPVIMCCCLLELYGEKLSFEQLSSLALEAGTSFAIIKDKVS